MADRSALPGCHCREGNNIMPHTTLRIGGSPAGDEKSLRPIMNAVACGINTQHDQTWAFKSDIPSSPLLARYAILFALLLAVAVVHDASWNGVSSCQANAKTCNSYSIQSVGMAVCDLGAQPSQVCLCRLGLGADGLQCRLRRKRGISVAYLTHTTCSVIDLIWF